MPPVSAKGRGDEKCSQYLPRSFQKGAEDCIEKIIEGVGETEHKRGLHRAFLGEAKSQNPSSEPDSNLSRRLCDERAAKGRTYRDMTTSRVVQPW